MDLFPLPNRALMENHTHLLWDWGEHHFSQLSSWVEMELNLNPEIIQPSTVIAVVTIGVSTPLLLFLLLCAISYAKMTLGHQARLLSKFPHYWKFPLIGNLWAFPLSPEALVGFFSRAVKRNGRRFVCWMGHKPFVILVEAGAVQKVLSSSKHVEKGSIYSAFHWLFGNGLITSKADIWRNDRKLLSPSFKYQRLDGFLSIFNKYSHTLVQVLEASSSQEVILHPILCRATMDFINESALGQPSHFQYELDSKFLEVIHMILNNFRTRILKPYLTLPFIWDIFGLGKEEPLCKETTSKIVCDVIKSRKEKKLLENEDVIPSSGCGTHSSSEEEGSSGDPGATSSPFIDALIPTKTDEDILAHVLTIFGAGFETTASGMNYTLFLLALHPQIQDKVHAELDSVFGGDPDLDVTFTHLSELKYLEMCVKEALRLYPPAPVILRSLQEDVELDNGQTIPSGCDITFLLYELHRDPEVFPDPEAFIPERFLPEACVARHPYAYIPFSIGPRNCLGMRYAMVQMKACLAHILRHFRVSTKQKKKDLRLVYGMVLEPSSPIKVTLTPRRSSRRP